MTKKELALVYRLAREEAGVHKTCPVTEIDGFDKPRHEGSSWHYETPSGQYVRFPSAYRRAFGKPVYCSSSNKVIVGRGWLCQCLGDFWNEQDVVKVYKKLKFLPTTPRSIVRDYCFEHNHDELLPILS